MLNSAARSPRSPRMFRCVVAALALALVSCVDAPSAPEGAGTARSLVVAPSFDLVGPHGVSPATPAQATALQDAFDRVDRFRVVVTRQSGDTIVDEIHDVTPGEQSYTLTAEVTPESPDEVFIVSITALQGTTELFRAENITVKATPTGTGETPPAVNIALEYSGPGSTATTLQVSPAYAVVSPGGTAAFSAAVQDQGGTPIDGVPIAWTLESPAGASVSADGVVTAGSDGVVGLVATTPTGLQAHARVYVVSGNLTYVEGGAIKVRGAGGGSAVEQPSVGGASQPSWGDGRLFYVSGGSVYESGSNTALTGGGWPSLSPDGTKLAVDAGGTVLFVNDDGTNPTTGPTGSTPIWLDDSSVLVAGGSIQSVRADGTNRTTVVPGEAALPALGPGGRIAYVSGGDLRVAGVPTVLVSGVAGRPSWSDDGTWLAVVDGDGLSIVPADGSAPAVPLPGLSGASDPVFNSGGGGGAPLPVSLTGLDPSSPVPGGVVHILGSGFDWIIPDNDHVLWPTSSGDVELKIRSVHQDYVEVTMPLSAVEGQITVSTRSSSGTLDFKPQLGAVRVTALTAAGTGVAGVAVSLRDAGGTEVAHGETDKDGALLLANLIPGTYTAALKAPAGFVIKGDTQRTIAVEAATTTVKADMLVQAKLLIARPDPLVVEVGGTTDVTLVPYDINGNVIPSVETAKWLGGPPNLSAAGTGLTGTITGLIPSATQGGSHLTVELDGVALSVAATVTSYIAGTLTMEGAVAAPTAAGATDTADTLRGGASPKPQAMTVAEGVTVNLMQGQTQVASTVSDASGAYRFGNLLAGTYDVVPQVSAPRKAVPTKQTITLGAEVPAGKADFTIAAQTVETVELDAGTATLDALGATLTIGVTAKDGSGNVLVRTPTFTSLNPSIATVDADGKVTAVANGTATIQVTVDAKVQTIDITVAQKAVSLVLLKEDGTPEDDAVRVLVPDSHDAKWAAKDANGHPITDRVPTFISSNTAVLTIDAAGHVETVAAGVAVVTATMDGASDQVTVNAFKVISHDVDLTNAADLAELASAPVGEIDGSLVVHSTSLTTLSGLGLETIWLITGNVSVTDNASLADIVALGGVEEIGGDVDVTNNDALLAPPPPVTPAALRHVGGSVYVSGNLVLANLDVFSNLEDVAGSLEVANNDALTELDGLTSLQYIGGDLLLRENPSLNSLGNLPALQDIGGSGLTIQGGGQVIGLPALQTIEGDLTVGGGDYDATILTNLQLPQLVCANTVGVYGNTTLATVGLPNLQHVGSCGPAVSPPLQDVTATGPKKPPLVNPVAARYGSVRDNAARVRAAARSALEARWRARAQYEAKIRAAAGRTPRVRRAPLETSRPEAAALTAAMRARLDAMARPSPRSALVLDAQRVLSPQRTGEISGSVTIQDNSALSTVQLGSLQNIGGGLSVSGNSVLATLQLPVLHDMGGGIFTDGNLALSGISAPMLVYVDGFLDIGDEPDLQTLDFPLLQRVGDYFSVYANGSLTQLTLPAFQYVGSYLMVGSNNALQAISLPGLVSTGSTLEIDDNGSLTNVTLASSSALTVNGDLYIHDNDVTNLWTVTVPGLMSVTGEVWLGYNYGLSAVSMATSVTAHVDGNFTIASNSDVQTLDFPKLQRVGGTLELSGMDDPQSMDFSGLTDVVMDLYLSNNGAPGSFDIDLTNLQHVDGSIGIDTNQGLAALSLPNLEHVGGSVDVGWNDEIATFSAPLLDGAVGSVSIAYNPLLTSFNLHALNHIDAALAADIAGVNGPQATAGGSGTLYVGWNDALTGFDLAGLSNVQSVTISDNSALQTLPGMPSLGPGTGLLIQGDDVLVDVSGLSAVTQLDKLDLEHNASLTDLSGLSALTDLGTLSITGNDQLTQVTSLTSLTHVLNGITLDTNSSLTTVDFPALTTIGDGNGPSANLGNLDLSGNGALANVSFGSLSSMDGTLSIADAGGLADLAGFTSLISAVYSVIIQNNGSLSDITGLEGIGTTTFSSPAIANGFDFFTGNPSLYGCTVDNTLYAMRIHTADKLPVPWATAFPGTTETYHCAE